MIHVKPQMRNPPALHKLTLLITHHLSKTTIKVYFRTIFKFLMTWSGQCLNNCCFNALKIILINNDNPIGKNSCYN